MTKMLQNEYYGNILVLCTYYAEISLDMKGSHANTETYPGIADNCRSRSVLQYYHLHTNMASKLDEWISGNSKWNLSKQTKTYV